MAGSHFAVKANGVILTPNDDGGYVIKNVMTDQVVTVEGVIMGGLIKVANGAAFDNYFVYIANGSTWEQYMPYVADGTNFNLCS